MANLQKFLIVFTLSIASLFSGMIISSLTKSASVGRTIGGLIGAISYGFLAFIVGFVISAILVIKVPAVKIKSIL